MTPIPSIPARCFTFVFLTSLLLLSGCKDDEEKSKSEISFLLAESEVDEGHSVVVELALSVATTTTEYITISVSSADATFGVDYGIGGLYDQPADFVIKIPANSKTANFTFVALEDFEEESTESPAITIMDVSSGLIASGNPHTVNINNVTNHNTTNMAMTFDGVDDYIDLGDIYDDLALPLTISAWVWLDPTAPAGQVMPIFDSQDGLPLYNGFNFITSMTSAAGIQYGDGFGENNSIYRRAKAAIFSPVDGRWVNFTAVVKAASDMNIYFNGVDVGGEYQGESTNPMNSDSPAEVAKIGALYQNGVEYKFKGKIDELRIWDRALAAAEIQKIIFVKSSAQEAGLVGYWNFDEPAGNIVYDGSVNKFDGVIKGNASRVLSEVPVR